MTESIDVFSKMREANDKGVSRLEREPCWKWETEKAQDPLETGNLRILTVNWNLHGESAPRNLNKLFRPDIEHHMYVIATEECMRSIPASMFVVSKKSWED